MGRSCSIQSPFPPPLPWAVHSWIPLWRVGRLDHNFPFQTFSSWLISVLHKLEMWVDLWNHHLLLGMPKRLLSFSRFVSQSSQVIQLLKTEDEHSWSSLLMAYTLLNPWPQAIPNHPHETIHKASLKYPLTRKLEEEEANLERDLTSNQIRGFFLNLKSSETFWMIWRITRIFPSLKTALKPKYHNWAMEKDKALGCDHDDDSHTKCYFMLPFVTMCANQKKSDKKVTEQIDIK